jgi:hypothetical protein
VFVVRADEGVALGNPALVAKGAVLIDEVEGVPGLLGTESRSPDPDRQLALPY